MSNEVVEEAYKKPDDEAEKLEEGLENFKSRMGFKSFGIGLEILAGAMMIGPSAFNLGQDNFLEYGQAINGGILAAGGLMTLHAYYRTIGFVGKICKELRHELSKYEFKVD